MASKKLTAIQKRIMILEVLFEAGFKTEKAILDMSVDQILSIDGLSVDELRMISELQKSVKNHKIITFLSGGDDIEQ